MRDEREPLAAAEEWQVTDAVTCVSCPACAFTFDGVHTDSDGGYSCPACGHRTTLPVRHGSNTT